MARKEGKYFSVKSSHGYMVMVWMRVKKDGYYYSKGTWHIDCVANNMSRDHARMFAKILNDQALNKDRCVVMSKALGASYGMKRKKKDFLADQTARQRGEIYKGQGDNEGEFG